MPRPSESSTFNQGLAYGKDVYVIEGVERKDATGREPVAADTVFGTPLFHVVVEAGETPDEAEVTERAALHEERYQPQPARLLAYEELAERQRVLEQASGQQAA